MSITERELQHAREEKLGEEKVLLLLLDPDAEWPASQIDAVSGELSRRDRLWKEHVQNESVAPMYVTRADLSRWFRHGLITHSIDCMPGDDDAVQMQRIMDRLITRMVQLRVKAARSRRASGARSARTAAPRRR